MGNKRIEDFGEEGNVGRFKNEEIEGKERIEKKRK